MPSRIAAKSIRPGPCGSGSPADELICNLTSRIAALSAENERLAEVVAARDGFLAVAAHELKNALTPVVARVEILRRRLDGWQPDKIESNLSQLEQAAGIFARRATTLLDVSRMAAGKLRLDKARIAVVPVIQAVCDNFRPLAERVKCDITIALPDPDLAIVGDQQALEQIVDNLVSNAIKYCAGAPISVRAEPVGDFVHLSVADRGPGISHEAHMRIFECFERAVRRGEEAGFGIGLWVIRHLSETMGGEVRVTARPGGGSTFCVVLPRHTGALR
ncbi:sensor histidine kinase [Glacieibacterium sp.]|uniref:sensor histidine kinase n=1 Tax=Glacieibacterium sp. TaxID=2860237 RepID=UPI003B005371